MKAKYTLEDFHTKTRNEKATKMPLLFDGEDTGIHLMVKGIEARSVAQARLGSQIAYAACAEHIETLASETEKKKYLSDSLELIKTDLAMALMVGWSFSEKFTTEAADILLQENQGLADSIVAHASTAANYFEKK